MSDKIVGTIHGMYFTQLEMDDAKVFADGWSREAESFESVMKAAKRINRGKWEFSATRSRRIANTWKNLYTIYCARVGKWSKTHPDPNID